MKTVEPKDRRRARARYVSADEVLVGLVASGDDEAFAGLIRRHSGLVRAVVRGSLGPREAEDACQEVWALVWRRIGGFRGDAAFATWLYRVAFNHCLDALRKDERRRSGELSASAEAPPVLTQVEDGPEEALLAKERLREARELLLRALPVVREEHRAAFVLRHGEGLSYEEVAGALGVPRGTAKGWAHRGRLALLAVVGADGFGPRGECPSGGVAGRAAQATPRATPSGRTASSTTAGDRRRPG